MPTSRPRVRSEPKTVSRTSASFSELEDNLRIDEHRLEFDCVAQPELFYQVAKQLAEKEGEREVTKQKLADKQAEVEIIIREEADAADSRVTVNEVAARVNQDSVVRSLSSKLLEISGLIGKLKALKEGYVQRKDALRELVALYINNYYADPARGAESRFKDAATERLRQARRERNNNSRD